MIVLLLDPGRRYPLFHPLKPSDVAAVSWAAPYISEKIPWHMGAEGAKKINLKFTKLCPSSCPAPYSVPMHLLSIKAKG